MKNSIFLMTLVLGIKLIFNPTLNAQCPETLLLQSQTDIDEFGINHPDCDSVNTLIINGYQSEDYITDLSPLSGITHVKWTLVIANNDSLESLNPLNVLGPVSNLRVSNNPLIENLEGLEGITSTNEIKLHSNNVLNNIQALSNVSGNNTKLDLKYNTNLTSLDGLQNLTGLSSMEILYASIHNFEGLDNVEEIKGTVKINYNNNLETLDGLNALTCVGGDTFDGDFFWLSGNPNLTSLSALSNLNTLNLNLEIFGNHGLENLSGLENVLTFSGALRIETNVNLKSITELEHWNITTGHLSITDNYALDSCACTSICDYLNSSEWRLIEDNGSGCENEASILANCPQVDNDNDGFFGDEDCDDSNADINPDATEVPYNGVDDDCNTTTPDDDLDQDGFGFEYDCNDENAEINPGETEIPYNGMDDDCNATTPDDDLDMDGFGFAEDCDDNNAQINPEAEEIPDNEIDEDCDGMDLVSSIHQIADSTIDIFPNPVIDVINIIVNGQLTYSTSLYDLNGKLISSSGNARAISVKSIPRGTYLLEIKDLKTGQKIVEKIIVGK
jgi:hypothetical protein